MKDIIKKALESSLSYNEYRTLLDNLFELGKTTGLNHSEAYLHYAELNIQRMNKWDKYFKIKEEQAAEIARITENQTWLVISEGWCGDAAHALPVMNALATINSHINFRVVLRDENTALIDLYLTNGGRSIPKLIILDQDLNDVATWGPRPEEATKMFTAAKQAGTSKEELNKDLQLWYARNRGVDIANELIETALQTA